jgi:hypothetical protein
MIVSIHELMLHFRWWCEMVVLPEVIACAWACPTWSDLSNVTGSHGSMFCAFAAFSRLFSYYSSSTKCSTAVQVPGLPEVTEGQYPPYWGLFIASDVIKRHVEGSSLGWVVPMRKQDVCACATKSCAISALLSPFHRKWRHQASRHSFGFPWKGNVLACATNICTISDQTSPVGLPLENMRACMHDRKYPWGAL